MSSDLPGPQLAEVLTAPPDAEMRQAGLSLPAWDEAAATCTELPPFFSRDTADLHFSTPTEGSKSWETELFSIFYGKRVKNNTT